MDWYNQVRRHDMLNGITPAQKWAQGFSCSMDRQQYEPASAGMSRPDSSNALSVESKRPTFAMPANRKRMV